MSDDFDHLFPAEPMSRPPALPEAEHSRETPCTLHVFAAGLIGRLAGRASLPGATFCPLCHEYLGGTRAPVGWPRCKSSGELRLERQYRD